MNSTPDTTLSIESPKVTLLPAPQGRIHLNDVRSIRREMGRLYREARGGKINISDAARFCYILSSMAKLVAEQEFEARLKALENIK